MLYRLSYAGLNKNAHPPHPSFEAFRRVSIPEENRVADALRPLNSISSLEKREGRVKEILSFFIRFNTFVFYKLHEHRGHILVFTASTRAGLGNLRLCLATY